MADVAIPYEEPAITTILVQSSFLLLSNIINAVLDHVFYCGLVGQVLLGMAWGTPGAKLLSPSFQEVATQLGYLGLIAIVFEGGLATSAKAVQKTLLLSICVAVTGIVLPIALSFSLLAIAGATNLQAFAAGSALCSTSLGTTFSLLKTTGLTTSRLGTVLTSAAMLDDVVGLVMVQVIANLGSGHGPVQASTVLRPIFVSVGFAIVIPLVCKFLVGPLLRYQISGNAATVEWLRKVVSGPWFYVVLSTATLVALVCAARYAGTSALFAAYLAGAVITWVDDSTQTGVQPAVAAQRKSPRELNRMVKPATDHMANTGRQLEQNGQIQAMSATAVNEDGQLQIRPVSPPRLPTPPPESNTGVKQSASSARAPKPPGSEGRGMHMYRQYYAQAVERILKPLFFVSRPRQDAPCRFLLLSNITGFSGIFDPHHPNVSSVCRLAWVRVCDFDGGGKTMLWHLAHPVHHVGSKTVAHHTSRQ